MEKEVLQRARWPANGRHILAQYDAETVVVYQAYRREIGSATVRDQCFGAGGFSYDRMSWIKPNFLWMMYRCGWASKPDQEVVLAVRIRRSGFDEILRRAVHSTFVAEVYSTRESWQAAVAASNVRLQWDPDHDPQGRPLERRAIQLGLRADMLREYGRSMIVAIEDVSEVARTQGARISSPDLETPREEVYPVIDAEVRARLGLSSANDPR